MNKPLKYLPSRLTASAILATLEQIGINIPLGDQGKRRAVPRRLGPRSQGDPVLARHQETRRGLSEDGTRNRGAPALQVRGRANRHLLSKIGIKQMFGMFGNGSGAADKAPTSPEVVEATTPAEPVERSILKDFSAALAKARQRVADGEAEVDRLSLIIAEGDKVAQAHAIGPRQRWRRCSGGRRHCAASSTKR